MRDHSCSHTLIVTNLSLSLSHELKKINQSTFRKYDDQQMLQLVTNVCDDSEQLCEWKQVFLSWFREKNISGSDFAEYGANKLGHEIISYCNDKSREATVHLLKQMNEYNVDDIKKDEQYDERGI